MQKNEQTVPQSDELAAAEEAAASRAEEQPVSEPQASVKPKRSANSFLANYFTATRRAYMAVFTALSFILRLPWFEFPLFPAVPFLKVDFSGVFALIAGFSLGPVAGVVVSALKELIYALAFTQTVGVGELANILIMLPFILVPSFIYKKYKGIKAVIASIAIGCVSQAVISIPVNYLLTFPFFLNLYMHKPWVEGMRFYLDVWYWALLFNIVKTLLLSVAVLLLYKPLSRLIKLTSDKFSKRGRGRKEAT